MQKKFFRSFIAVFVAVLMVLSAVPTVAFATETDTSVSQGTDIISGLEKFAKSLYDFIMYIINFFKNLSKPGGGSSATTPKYDYKYYASLNAVLGDIGSGAVGENAVATAETADIAVYEDENGNINIMLLKNLTIEDNHI